ncbi:MAG: FAD:protein FMN transferase [Pseudomonadota bacterium]
MADLLKLSRRSVLMMPIALAACKNGASVLRLTGPTMGTTFTVVAIDEERSLTEADLSGVIQTALAEVDASLSNWNPRSEISRLNATTDANAFQMSRDLATVMDAAETVHLASDGRFDTTMGPLIELWGFGAPGTSPMPTEDAIAEALSRTGHGNVLSLDANAVRKRRAEAQVYLAGIGKGYGADHVARAIEALGIRNYMVEIGGDIYASGRNTGGVPWQIGIETPTALGGGVHQVVGLSGLGLASSGDYRNYFEQDGRRFSHVIDPGTGHPITHQTASATVLAENSMLADAWSTAMLILGRERGREIAEAHDVAVLFIDRDGTDFRSEASTRFDELTA